MKTKNIPEQIEEMIAQQIEMNKAVLTLTEYMKEIIEIMKQIKENADNSKTTKKEKGSPKK